jgi:hypothetical protein
MAYASILHCSGGNVLVEILTPLPATSALRRVLDSRSNRSFLFTNTIAMRDRFRERLRRAPLSP